MTTHGGGRSLSNCFCVASNRYESEAAEEGRHLLSVFFFLWNLSTEVKESFDLYPEKLDSKMEM
jgi:hypothetical protein